VYLLNRLLEQLGEEQDADIDWAYDKVKGGDWFTANHPDGRMVVAWIMHVEPLSIGYDEVELLRTDADVARWAEREEV